MSLCGIRVISVTMYSDRYDSFVPNVTDDYIWFKQTQSGGHGTSTRCWARVVEDGPALVRRWVGVPCLLRGYLLCVDSVLVHRLQHWDLQYCVIILLFGCFVQHICFLLLTCDLVTYKPKWAGYYIVNIFILSL